MTSQSDRSSRGQQIDTLLIHAGEPSELIEGAINLPIFQSATFAYGGADSYADLRYIRLNNTPNHRVLHAKLAAIAGAEAGLVAASGMAAITAMLASFLATGDHILVTRGLYGGTHTLLHHDASRFGWAVDVLDDDPSVWPSLVNDRTRIVYTETISNPLLDVGDLEAIAAFGEAQGIVSAIDNTFASPINCKPHALGFDLVIESCTKYLNGHSDIVAGCVTGSQASIRRITETLNHLGGCLDPHAAFLLRRGLQTLSLRVRQQNANALALARCLDERSDVVQVRYPFLDGHPQLERAKRLLSGGGGVVSFELSGGASRADRVLSSLKLAKVAPSLGGVETLVTRPATTSHLGMTPKERAEVGISDGLVRVACGIEAAADLCEDFTAALDAN